MDHEAAYFGWYDLDDLRELLDGKIKEFNHYEDYVEWILLYLTEVYPEASFEVRGWGEENDDVWVRRYAGGRRWERRLVKRWAPR
jgi:hypothetical protein